MICVSATSPLEKCQAETVPPLCVRFFGGEGNAGGRARYARRLWRMACVTVRRSLGLARNTTVIRRHAVFSNPPSSFFLVSFAVRSAAVCDLADIKRRPAIQVALLSPPRRRAATQSVCRALISGYSSRKCLLSTHALCDAPPLGFPRVSSHSDGLSDGQPRKRRPWRGS